MNTITLTIAATPDNLKKLAEAFGDTIDETLAADDTPAKRHAAGSAPKKDAPAPVKSAEIPEEKRAHYVPQVTAPAAEEPKEEKKLTLSDLRSKGAALTKNKDHLAALRDLLAEFGAERIGDVKEEEYAEFYARMEAIG